MRSSERRARLGQIVAEAEDLFVYEYDFDDAWEHEVVVEEELDPEPGHATHTT